MRHEIHHQSSLGVAQKAAVVGNNDSLRESRRLCAFASLAAAAEAAEVLPCGDCGLFDGPEWAVAGGRSVWKACKQLNDGGISDF